jgi:hypothetical protein
MPVLRSSKESQLQLPLVSRPSRRKSKPKPCVVEKIAESAQLTAVPTTLPSSPPPPLLEPVEKLQEGTAELPIRVPASEEMEYDSSEDWAAGLNGEST